jgi:tail tube protein
MTTVTKWSNVQIAIQTALGTAQTITAISKADPAVVTSNGHAVATGDFVRVDAEGMFQVDDRVFRASATTSNSFALEEEDSTLYDTFSSGTAKVVTFGTVMATVRGLTAGGGDFDFIDITTVHDNIRKQIPGLPQASNYALENIWDASDAALIALKTAADNQSLLAFKLAFANGAGAKVAFLGYVGATLLPTGNAQDLVVTPVTITMFGRPTIYST